MLLERHRAGLHAVALSILGHGPQAEDAVHDAFLVALRRLDELREPAAVGAWLRTVARRACLVQLSDLRERPVERIEELAGPAVDALPARAVDRVAVRDWVWTALEQLSEPLKLTAMLRYFSQASSYEEMAAVCGVPVGTVRSRLSQARSKLGEALLETAARAHSDAGALNAARRRHLDAVFDQYNRGSSELYAASCTDDITVRAGTMIMTGRETVFRGLDEDIEAGVKLHVLAVVASPDITILEGRFENPRDDPLHCPPATTQVYLHRGETIRAARFHYAARPSEAA
jgi:RNA polymerase sigma factor (sigma-70 family)